MGDVNDPFYLVKEEIQLSVDKAKAVTERMDRLPEHNGERARYANEIVTECDSVVWQLEELNRATGMAERDFVRFRVDANELSSRKRWTSVTKDAVVAMRGNARRVVDGAAEKQKRAGGQNSNQFAAGAAAGVPAAAGRFFAATFAFTLASVATAALSTNAFFAREMSPSTALASARGGSTS